MPAVHAVVLVAPLLTPERAKAEAAATEAASTTPMCLCLMAVPFFESSRARVPPHVVDEREEFGRAGEAPATPLPRPNVLDDTVQVCRDRVGDLGGHPDADYE